MVTFIGAGGADGAFFSAVFSGRLPVFLRFTTLLSRSNQNGAPIDTAPAVKIIPRILKISHERLDPEAIGSSLPAAVPVGLAVFAAPPLLSATVE